MSFQITLKCARINIGLTQKESAKIFGVHYETIGNYEKDSTNVPMSFYKKIEKAYGFPLDMIYFGKEKEFHKKMRDKALKSAN